jgi:tetratricopeptide (TPR) repeat protein
MPKPLVLAAVAFYPFLESRGLYDQIERHLTRAQQAARDLNDSSNLAVILLDLGVIEQRQKDYEKAQQHLNEALRLAVNDPGVRIDTLNILAFIELYIGELEPAEKYLQEALELAQANADTRRIAITRSFLGLWAAVQGENELAKQHLSDGLEKARQSNDRETTGRILGYLGGVAMVQKDLDAAEKYLTEGLSIIYDIGHIEASIRLLDYLGTLETRRQEVKSKAERDFSQAQSYFLQGLVLADRDKIKDLRALAHLHGNMADALFQNSDKKEEQLERAQHYVTVGLEIARKIEDWDSINIMLHTQGEIHLKKGNLEQAQTAFREALVIVQEQQIPEVERRRAEAKYGLARVAKAQQNTDEACKLGREAAQLFAEAQDARLQEVEQWLADLGCPKSD